MKEEKIYLGTSDYSFSYIIWASKVGTINNRVMPTLTALGLIDNADVIIDVAINGSEYLTKIFEDKFLNTHPAMIEAGLKSYAKWEVERTVNAACKEFSFAPVEPGLLSSKEAQYLKTIAVVENGRLSVDVKKLEKKHEVYATGENAKLYKEIENALKVFNNAFRNHLDKETFNTLFFWGDDKRLHFKDCIQLKTLNEIRGVKE